MVLFVFITRNLLKETNYGTCAAEREDASLIDGDRTSQQASHAESSYCENIKEYNPYIISEIDGTRPFGYEDLPYVSLSSGFQSLAGEGGRTVSIMPSVDVGDAQYGYQMPSASLSYSSDMSTVRDESCIFSKSGYDIKANKNVESITSDEKNSIEYDLADELIRRKHYGGRQWPGMNHQRTKIGISGLNSKYRPNISYQGVRSNKVEHVDLEDDDDVCILEHMSTPAVASDPVTLTGLYAPSKVSTSTDPSEQIAMGHSGLRPDNERVIFQVAMQVILNPDLLCWWWVQTFIMSYLMC